VFRYTGGRRDWFAAGRGMEGTRARRLQAGAVARRNVPTCRLDDRLSDVRARVRASGSDVCIVVNEAGVVLGRLGHAAWTSRRRATSVERAMDIPTTYRPDIPLDSLIDHGRGKAGADLLITDSDGVLIGLVDPRDARRLVETERKRRRARPKRHAKSAGSRAKGGRGRARSR
jgi:CBS domain-containing protein